jgi:hypothetical protein
MRRRLGFGIPLSISVAAMFLALLALRVNSISVKAATQPKYITEAVVPNPYGDEQEGTATRQAIQDALDKKSADGWQLQTMTVRFDSKWTSPVYVLVFKK